MAFCTCTYGKVSGINGIPLGHNISDSDIFESKYTELLDMMSLTSNMVNPILLDSLEAILTSIYIVSSYIYARFYESLCKTR